MLTLGVIANYMNPSAFTSINNVADGSDFWHNNEKFLTRESN